MSGDLFYKRVLVIGAARSGIAACRLLLAYDARISLYDDKPRELFASGEADFSILEAKGVELLLGIPPQTLCGYDLVVKSPGVPRDMPLICQACAQNIPVIGEFELACRYIAVPIVAITGTNGKTTVTALLGEMADDAGIANCVGGNIGVPLSDIVSRADIELIIAEVSSFQLEDSMSFSPYIGVITNITPDHLDRHSDMDRYAAVKRSVFSNQKSGDFAVLNYDDMRVRGIGEAIGQARRFFFSRKEHLNRGVFLDGGFICVKDGDKFFRVIEVTRMLIRGCHNVENALAAVACGYLLGIKPETLADTLSRFRGVPHRQEVVAEKEGVLYINDSKGTNPDSTICALEAFDMPIVLIAGGRHKGGDLRPLMRLAAKKVRLLVLVGECRAEMAGIARECGLKNIIVCDGFAEAVSAAVRDARQNEVVLLSPAAASWDMFDSYEHRGEVFKQTLRALLYGEGDYLS